MGNVKLKTVVLLTVLMVALAATASGPAGAAAQTGTGASQPGSSSITIETPTQKLSGSSGEYVNLPAKITNVSDKPVESIVAYVTLVETTQGQQAPVDLEDWSAHRAIVIGSLAPGETKNASWDLRLIKGGDYVLYAAAVEQGSSQVAAGPEVPLSVTSQKNLNPGGVLPIALGVPMLVGAALFGPLVWRRRNLTA